MEFKQLKNNLMEIIEQAPQSKHIGLDVRSEWVDILLESLQTTYEKKQTWYGKDYISKQEFIESEALWSVKRMWGWGGSEIGALVQEHMGEYAPFKTAVDLVSSKLLMTSPVIPDGNMLRGTVLEQNIRHMFHAEYCCDTDFEAIERINNSDYPGAPWMKANIDDYVDIGGMKYITDYKAPGELDLAKYQRLGIGMDYAAQLEQYAMKAEAAGVKVDGLLLVPLDYREFKIYPIEYESNEELREMILNAGNHYWNEHVMSGIVPEYNQKYKITSLSDLPEEFQELTAEYTVYDRISKSADEKAQQLKGIIRDMLVNYNICQEDKVQIGIVDVTIKEKEDIDNIQLMAELHKAIKNESDKKVNKPKNLTESLWQLVEHISSTENSKLKDAIRATMEQTEFTPRGKRISNTNEKEFILNFLSNSDADFDKAEFISKSISYNVGITRSRKGEAAELKQSLDQKASEMLVRTKFQLHDEKVDNDDNLITSGLRMM